ncbi:hypothetical protein [Leadbettera azotonutricia]|uniref:Uncharacterized protein n=1 Tax=Leadbettera azotonutricia (strain ATCC BAA-888 / DSM 13862 / ZAS-9) TaxID=545695 RepID=F5YF65_LEAAZ|nr:hypothetical protein [Leadbettera azotonutricia]AEF82082.1 hypothetical protein TREAZ_2498 [Leadbettera azotonutricia ZAS-9]
MTKAEWADLQEKLQRYSEQVTRAGEVELRKLLEKHAEMAVRSYNFDVKNYALELEKIINQCASLPAQKAQAIADRAIEEAMTRAGIRGEVDKETLTRKLYATAEKEYEIPKGQYRSRPDGTVVYVPAEKTLEFLSKYHLSGDTRPQHVWKIGDICQANAYEKEKEIMGIVRTGIADGVDAADILKDLDAHINGKPVKGRWGKLRPDSEFDALVDKLIAEEGYSPQGARSMAGKIYKQNGWERLPGSKEYYARFGAEGRDWRSIRLLRTEQAVTLSNRQKEIALNNPAVDNKKVVLKLEGGRDAWACACSAFCRASGKGKILGDDGFLHNEDGSIVTVSADDDEDGKYVGESVSIPPWHPNCSCSVSPVLLSEEEFQDKILKKYGLL